MQNQRKMPRSPFGYIALRRPDGSQANVSTRTTDRYASTLIATSAKVLVDASGGKPIPINDILEVTENICNTISKKYRTPIEAIPYLRGLIKEHTGSERYACTQMRVVDLLNDVLIETSRPDEDIRDVTGDDIGRLKANLVAFGRGVHTVRTYLDTLGALFEMGVARGVLEDNVVRQVDKPPRPKHSPRRPFTDDELKRVFAVADDEWRGMIMVGLYIHQGAVTDNLAERLGHAIPKAFWNSGISVSPRPEPRRYSSKRGLMASFQTFSRT